MSDLCFEDWDDEEWNSTQPLYEPNTDTLDANNEPMKSLDEVAYARPENETVGDRIEYAIRLLHVHGLINDDCKKEAFWTLDDIRSRHND